MCRLIADVICLFRAWQHEKKDRWACPHFRGNTDFSFSQFLMSVEHKKSGTQPTHDIVYVVKTKNGNMYVRCGVAWRQTEYEQGGKIRLSLQLDAMPLATRKLYVYPKRANAEESSDASKTETS